MTRPRAHIDSAAFASYLRLVHGSADDEAFKLWFDVYGRTDVVEGTDGKTNVQLVEQFAGAVCYTNVALAWLSVATGRPEIELIDMIEMHVARIAAE